MVVACLNLIEVKQVLLVEITKLRDGILSQQLSLKDLLGLPEPETISCNFRWQIDSPYLLVLFLPFVMF